MNAQVNPLPRFLTVGAIGFAVDAGVLWALITLGSDPYLARVPSFLLAVTVTWVLNRRWTFHAARPKRLHREFLAYACVQTIGIGINFATYAATLTLLGPSAASALIALACGSGLALFTNFLGLKHVVFRGARASA